MIIYKLKNNLSTIDKLSAIFENKSLSFYDTDELVQIPCTIYILVKPICTQLLVLAHHTILARQKLC